MNGLALQVQQALGRDPHGGDLYVFRGRRGDLFKILWHDGLGMSLYAKRLEKRPVHMALAGGWRGAGTRGAAWLHARGIDWRNPQHTWRPRLPDRPKNLLVGAVRKP